MSVKKKIKTIHNEKVGKDFIRQDKAASNGGKGNTGRGWTMSPRNTICGSSIGAIYISQSRFLQISGLC
jgi:hypothetical protein